jgi:hypothetical protein
MDRFSDCKIIWQEDFESKNIRCHRDFGNTFFLPANDKSLDVIKKLLHICLNQLHVIQVSILDYSV